MASPLPWGERVRVRGNGLMVTPTLVLPRRGGGEFLENWMPRSSAAGYFTCARHDALAEEVRARRYRTEGQRQQGKGMPRDGCLEEA